MLSLSQRFNLHLREFTHAEFEQGGVAIQFQIWPDVRRVGVAALTVEFLDGEHVQRNRIAAEARLIQVGQG